MQGRGRGGAGEGQGRAGEGRGGQGRAWEGRGGAGEGQGRTRLLSRSCSQCVAACSSGQRWSLSLTIEQEDWQSRDVLNSSGCVLPDY